MAYIDNEEKSNQIALSDAGATDTRSKKEDFHIFGGALFSHIKIKIKETSRIST